MLLATWLCVLCSSLYGFVYTESDKNEENALEEQRMENLAEWMSNALQKGNGKRPQFLEKLRLDDTSKREDNKEEVPGFVGVRGKRKNSDILYEVPFTAKRQESENFPPGFVAVRGKKETGSTGKKENPHGVIGVRGRKQQQKEQTGEIPPGFIAPRGKKQSVIGLPGYIVPRGKREDGPPGFIGVRGRRQDIIPGFVGVRGRRGGLVALINDQRRGRDERAIPLVLERNKDFYDIMDISQDGNEEDTEKKTEMESKQASMESDFNKLYIDCVTGNDYFCRRFVAIKG